jgi:hypothetical protein
MSPVTATQMTVEGQVSHGFETVRDVFAENFERRHELGVDARESHSRGPDPYASGDSRRAALDL